VVAKTQQQYKDETNPNRIVQRYVNTGELPHGNNSQPLYIDHTQFEDYTIMLNKTTELQQQFMKLHPRIRARFSNQPAELLAFLENPENRPEAEKMGLVKPLPKPKKTLLQEKGTKPSPSTPEASKPPEKEVKSEE